MKRKLVGVVVLVAVGLASSAALAEQRYTDPTGDSQTAADLTTTRVAGSTDGTVVLTIGWAGAQLLPKGDVIYLEIDTDQDGATGGAEGEEVVVELIGDPQAPRFGTGYYGRWDGTKMNFELDAPFATAVFGAGAITLTMSKAGLNDAATFDFWIYSDQYDADDKVVAEDVAPDGRSAYTYEPETTAPAPTLKVGRLVATPAAPVAGRRFIVAVHIVRSDAAPITGAKARCIARAGTSVIRAAGGFSDGFARCSMTVPKGTKGKLLRGTVSVAAGDAATSKAFAFRVR